MTNYGLRNNSAAIWALAYDLSAQNQPKMTE